MTDPKIAPRIVDGEPVCSVTKCPSWGDCLGKLFSTSDTLSFDKLVCAPGLRAQRDALQAERDAARLELCDELSMWANEFPVSSDPRTYAAERGWSYLYEKEGTK